MANMASACALVIANDGKMFGSIYTWRAREAASTCILVTISTVCVCIMVVCGVMLAREYSLSRGYESTDCVVRNVTYTGSDRSCLFCSGYKEKNREKGSGSCITTHFPCVQVTVTYIVDWFPYDALLHKDSIQASSINSLCSYNICLRDREDNSREVDKYADEWRSMLGKQFPCYYNMASFDDVILQKTYTLGDVVHSMFWPSLVIVICLVVFLRLETRRRKLTFCGRQNSVDESAAAIESSPSRKSTPDALESHVILRDGLHYGGVQCQLAGLMPPGVGGLEGTTRWKTARSSINITSSDAFDELRRLEKKRRSLDMMSNRSLTTTANYNALPTRLSPSIIQFIEASSSLSSAATTDRARNDKERRFSSVNTLQPSY